MLPVTFSTVIDPNEEPPGLLQVISILLKSNAIASGSAIVMVSVAVHEFASVIVMV